MPAMQMFPSKRFVIPKFCFNLYVCKVAGSCLFVRFVVIFNSNVLENTNVLDFVKSAYF